MYPAKTGGKKFIALFCEYLNNVEPITLISVTDNEVPAALQNNFIGLMNSSVLRYANPLLFFKLRRIIKQQGITDIIMVHPYFGWLVALLKFFTGVQLSLLSHNIESIRFKSMGKWWWRIMWWYEKNTHRIIDHNFFVTPEDAAFAIAHYKLSTNKCHVITYGIEWQQAPSLQSQQQCGTILRERYNIQTNETIILFNGTLDYLPNAEAVDYILNNINPLLLAHTNYHYKIIICGKGLADRYEQLTSYQDKNIIYAGFVDDINIYFKGADIFINPVISGGGIKTKLVEALGNNLTAISCANGALGIPQQIVGEKLTIVPDFEWQTFVNAIIKAPITTQIGPDFFNYFYWGNIAAKAAGIITSKTHK
ncbi:glycosyltransferase family 4 protein [Ferruginibacter yonginensis]|uniref:Glycosyltransferase family 4 protein n=1 Tax=Ferruginibacter yonginensis TaxID=1310416 RepID=A0ABV8QN31_9BACT